MAREKSGLLIAVGVFVTGLAGTLGWLVLGDRSIPTGQPVPTTVLTGQAKVVRADVAERNQFSGSLGHAGAYTVIAPASGTLTGFRDVGQVVHQGQSLYEVNGKPVVLMYGKVPVWRAFSAKMSDGADVKQLQAALKALGYGPNLQVSNHFSSLTHWAIRRWQAAAGLPVTGEVPLGQIVFLPQAIRITGHSVELGASVQPQTPVETGTTERRVVIVQLPPADLPTTKVGDSVMVLLPDGHTQRQGRIIAVSAAATPTGSSNGSGSGSEPTAQVSIEVDGAIPGFIEQAHVQVFITADLHKAVLAVPIVALRALPNGQYEVVVVDSGGSRHVPVTVGLFDDIARQAEVSGPGLSEGLQVEVPSGSA
ncbi:peptidoglycan-binding protein [Micromonospora sp. NPDC093277]|uniref:peptidoglycan-binding protein n=1 Tax=Micromonospora sp. NPDC093277 TaxID=3364291 RepID=UPI00380142BB